jgi:hypothetical protein
MESAPALRGETKRRLALLADCFSVKEVNRLAILELGTQCGPGIRGFTLVRPDPWAVLLGHETRQLVR